MPALNLIIPFVILSVTRGSAQNTSDPINNISYYTVADNKKVLECKTTGDSLFLTESMASATVRQRHFKIAGKEKKDDYYLVYVERPLPAQRPSKWKLPAVSPFGLFVLRLSPDKKELYVLLEDGAWYPSLEEAKKANGNTRFDSKYFATYYSHSTFTSLTEKPLIATVDKPALQKIIDDWGEEINKNKYKMQNTRTADVYRVSFMQDNLTKVLVEHHISPLTTITEFNSKLSEYKIPVPQIPHMDNRSRNNPLKK